MKKIIPSVALALLITFYLPACKKTDKQQTTAEKVQNKWQLVSDVENHHVSGQDHFDTIMGTQGDIVDFRTDGKVYFDNGGINDTSTYTLSSDTKIVLDTQVFDIITLTTNSFIFYEKTITGASDFDELTVTLKK